MQELGTTAADRYLLVRSGGERLALPTPEVLRIVDGLEVHPLRGGAAAFVGLARFSGEPLGVVEASGRPARPGPAVRRTVVVVRHRNRLLGIAVDAVERLAAPGEALEGWTIPDLDRLVEAGGGDDGA